MSSLIKERKLYLKELGMIFNIRMLIVAIMVSGNYSSESQNVIYDIVGKPIYSYTGDGLEFNNAQYYFREKCVEVHFDVQYIWGVDSLKNYIINSYYEHPNYNHHEINTTLFFSVFFDEVLNIKDIRFIDAGLSNQQKEFLRDHLHFKVVEEILKKTENDWQLKSQSSNKHNQLFIGSVKLM
jgi:hypothetical protein